MIRFVFLPILAVQTLVKEISRKHYLVSKDAWEKQYKQGSWEHLRHIDELAHYSVIVGYINYIKPTSSILDVGCGEGVLQERLTKGYKKYVGIDISSEAIAKANQKTDSKTCFLVSSLAEYTTSEKFDVIVFNEVLYYCKDPLSVVRYYQDLLKPDGIFIISMFNRNKTIPGFWSKLEGRYLMLDYTRVVNNETKSWNCKVFKLRSNKY